MSKKEEQKKKNKKKKKKARFQLIILAVCGAAAALLFLSISILLLIGMLPTFVPLAMRQFKFKTKDLTVGIMNFAGCTPFLVELSSYGRTMEKALEIALDPLSIVIIYAAAAFGAAIDWSVTGIASNLLYQKGKARRKAIAKRMDDLVDQWGSNVTGEHRLDREGFPVEDA